MNRLTLGGTIGTARSPVDPDHLRWKVKQCVGLHRNPERLRLRAERVRQARQEHLERLKASGIVLPPEVRRSALRLAASLEDLREGISERQAISPD